MANFTEIGSKIGSKIDTKVEKVKTWTKEHKKILIIGGATVGAIGAGAAAFTVYKNQKSDPETISGPIEEDGIDTDSTIDPEVSQDESLE